MTDRYMYTPDDVDQTEVDAIIHGLAKDLAGLRDVVPDEYSRFIDDARQKIAESIADEMNRQIRCVVTSFLTASGGELYDYARKLSPEGRALVIHSAISNDLSKFRVDPIGMISRAAVSMLENHCEDI